MYSKMSEKGGKGYGSSHGKSALKSQASLEGNDDNSAKSNKGRKVQFDFEESLEGKFDTSSKSNGKDDMSSAKGNWDKGGKGDKTGNAAKGPIRKDPPLELKVEQELPENAKCMMDCEAAEILQGIQDQMVVLSKDPSIKIPSSFDRGLQYAMRSNRYADPQSVRKELDALKNYGVTDGEICMIANTGPDSTSEAFALVPSLKDRKKKLKEPLKAALEELGKLKNAT